MFGVLEKGTRKDVKTVVEEQEVSLGMIDPTSGRWKNIFIVIITNIVINISHHLDQPHIWEIKVRHCSFILVSSECSMFLQDVPRRILPSDDLGLFRSLLYKILTTITNGDKLVLGKHSSYCCCCCQKPISMLEESTK